MKNRIKVLALATLFSCSEKQKQSNSNLLEDLNYTVDTVFIDTDGQPLFLQSGLSHSSLTNDQTRLLNFTPKDELEEIDLDSLRLLRKIATEKEGPLGTGLPYATQFDADGSWVLFGFNEMRVFSPDLDSMKRHPLTEEDLPGLAPEVLAPFNPKVVDRGVLYAIYETHEQVPQGLAIVSLEDKGIKKIPIDLASRIQPYTYSLKSNTRGYEPLHLALVGEHLILSTAYANEAIVFDLETGQVRIKSFHSELTQDKKPLPAKTAAETVNEMEELRREAEKSVQFGPFYFDKTHHMFWRFSRDLDHEAGDSLIYNNVLTVFDEDLNQLGEAVVPVNPFSRKFFKDGKFWSYVNVEDELGFAVFTFHFDL